jgi:hypothetical protein
MLHDLYAQRYEDVEIVVKGASVIAGMSSAPAATLRKNSGLHQGNVRRNT